MWFTNATGGGAYLTFSYCRKTVPFTFNVLSGNRNSLP